MGIIILAILLIAAFIRPKSSIVTACVMLFMWWEFWFPYHEGDLQTYEALYNYANVWALEPGYGVLVKCCLTVGLSFDQFRVVIATIYVLLIFRAIRKMTEYTAVAMYMACIFPLFVFCSVIRSGLACAFVLNGLACISSEKKGRMIPFAIWIILATSLHKSSIIFILAVFLQRKLNNYLIIIMMSLSVLFAILLNYTDVIQNTLITIVGNSRLEHFFSTETRANFTGIVAVMFALLANVIYSKIACIENDKLIRKGEISSKRTEQTELAFNLSVVWFLMFPLMIISNPFMRLLYMTYPMLVAVFTETVYRERNNDYSRKTGMFPVANLITLGLTILMELFFDAPYLAQGKPMIEELLKLYVI